MNERKFTPEEIAKSLKVCANAEVNCDGCVAEEDDLDCSTMRKAAVDLIEELAAENARLLEERRWIPVGERLPEGGAFEVLVMIAGAEKPISLYTNGVDFYEFNGSEVIPYSVTHWKPMPKGPEVRDAED